MLNVQFRKTRKKYYVHFFKRSNIFCAKTMPAEDSLHKNVQLPLHFEGRLSEDEQKRGKYLKSYFPCFFLRKIFRLIV